MNVLLAKIQFSFLEDQKGVKGWDNTFYNLFLLFSSMEHEFGDSDQDVNDRMLFLTNDNVYVKEHRRECIRVYLWKKQENPKDLYQMYLFFVYEIKEIPTMNELIKKIKTYLESSRRLYRIIRRDQGTLFIPFSKAVFYLGFEIFD